MGDSINAVKAKELLEQGNERYRAANANDGDIGPALRQSLYEQGQHPFATVITCSDSRVVPEHIFMAGLGQLFTVRVAGNIIGATQLASVVYGVEHLGTKLVVVLGHTGCGAVAAALQGDAEGCLHNLIGPIRKAIGERRMQPVPARPIYAVRCRICLRIPRWCALSKMKAWKSSVLCTALIPVLSAGCERGWAQDEVIVAGRVVYVSHIVTFRRCRSPHFVG